ncbi:MAG: hypothetical protein J6S26_01020 [Solobacterium sp.]|nr:hypothetical protein [Solobacterium sp.]
MTYQFPFGEILHPLIQKDQSEKQVFVLGVYASAVHAHWKRDGRTVCPALAVASEPRIFWDGDPKEAEDIIRRIPIPSELGTLEPAEADLNGPSARALDDHILAPLGFTRSEAWLCDCLPETRLNPAQVRAIRRHYEPLIGPYGLNEVTVPERPEQFCDEARAKEITKELLRSKADLLITLGSIPIAQYLKRVSDIHWSGLREYTKLYGYGTRTTVTIAEREIEVLPLTHPRQTAKLGGYSEVWYRTHQEWEMKITSSRK